MFAYIYIYIYIGGRDRQIFYIGIFYIGIFYIGIFYIGIFSQTYTVWRLIHRNENILKLTWMDGTKLFELVI